MQALPQGTAPRILVVDDERAFATAIAHILEARGYRVLALSISRLAVAAAFKFQPNLLVSEVVMLGMSGIQLAIEIRKIFPKCKVILVSGHSQAPQLMHEARATGFDFPPLLAKPVSPDDLFRAVAEQLYGNKA